MTRALPVFNRSAMAILSGHDFPLAILHMHGKDVMGAKHGHNFYELVLIVSGHGVYRHGHVTHTLKAGDIFLLCPGDVHYYVSQNELSLINVIWDAEAMPIQCLDQDTFGKFQALYRQTAQTRHFFNLAAQKLMDAINLAEAIGKELESCLPGCVLAAGSRLGILLSYLVRCERGNGNKDSEYRRMQISKILNYIQLHYAEKLSCQKLAALLHVSCATFYRYFHETTGQSFRDYLLGLRLAHGENLLRYTPLPITEIAARVGYPDSNYFITQFRRHFGVPPRSYRAAMRGE